MTNGSPSFCSKILLFGEYSIIIHSKALTVPYDLFEGRLLLRNITDNSKGIQQSNRELEAFSEYLKLKLENNELSADFDTTSLDFDIAQGLYFQSNIPQGFGVGSSGALTAALYERYVDDKIQVNGTPNNEVILKLKKVFGEMESHFHGSSSGADPLSCYLRKPLLFRSKTQIEATSIPDYSAGNGAVFLLNTARPRKTEPLVNLFLEKCRHQSFLELCQKELIIYNDNCIEAFLNAEHTKLFENLTLISQFQIQYFQPMIPTLFRQAWKEGLESGLYTLKLCGAGGGGFILGFTQNFRETRKMLRNYPIRMVYRI